MVYVRSEVVQRIAVAVRPVPDRAARRGDRLGLRHRQERRHPHQRPRRRRRGEGHASSSPTREDVSAKIVGRDPSTDLALLQGRPRRARPPAADAGVGQGRPGRRPDDRDRQPVRPRPHADHRRRVGPAAADPGARTASRSATSSRPTPRSTPATRAGRCSTPRAGSSASTPRSRPAARATATSASASPSRSTPPRRSLSALKDGHAVERAQLGVSTATIDASLAGLNLPVKSGVLVQSVQNGSPADKAGLRGGDITAQVNGSADPAGRRHHHQGRRQGRPDGRRPRDRHPGPQAGRQGQGHLPARRQGADRRRDARQAEHQGDPTGLSEQRERDRRRVRGTRRRSYAGGRGHARQALRHHEPRRRRAGRRGRGLGAGDDLLARVAAALRARRRRRDRQPAAPPGRDRGRVRQPDRSTRSPRWPRASR